MKIFIKSGIARLSSVVVVILLCSPVPSAGGVTGVKLARPHVSMKYKSNTSRILSVLKERIKDKKIFDKTKEKVLTLSDSEVSLIASLCDRISKNENTAASELAFSLVAALIILS